MPGAINCSIGFLICALLFYNNALAQNVLSAKEKQEGWTLLFNGKDFKGWHAYHEKTIGNVWRVSEGNIILNKNKNNLPKDYADLVTDEEFGDFDLKIEWKMKPCSNSGVLFYVDESQQYKNTYESGPEMQIADLACNDDGRILKCRAGDLYDLISADTEWVNKGGLWNQYEINSASGHLQFFMNGHKTIDTQIWDSRWREMIQNSKFKEWDGYVTFKKGHIALQGLENGMIWFRNVKIKRL